MKPMKDFTKHAAGQTEAPEDHNLHGFYGLLLKVYRRNQKEKGATVKALDKNKTTQTTGEVRRDNEI